MTATECRDGSHVWTMGGSDAPARGAPCDCGERRWKISESRVDMAARTGKSATQELLEKLNNSPKHRARVAAHEARHIAAAAMCGWTPVLAEIGTDGCGHSDFRAPDGIDGIRRIQDHAIIVLAGAASPFPNAFTGSAGDEADFREALRMLAERSRRSRTEIEDDLRQRMSWLVEREEFRRVEGRVANALVTRGSLGEAELADLVNAALESETVNG